MISTQEVDKAFHFLNDTIEEYARASSYLYGLKILEKTIMAEVILNSKLKTLGLKEAQARKSEAYKTWRDQIEDAVYQYETIKARRAHADMVWRRWQSEFSAIKQGVAI